ncbi:MAG: GtrA family protein [Bacilli bacterium]
MEIKTTKELFNKKELIVMSLVVLAITILSSILINLINFSNNYIEIAELRVNIPLLLPSLLISLLGGIIITIVPILFKLPAVKPILSSKKYWIIYMILFVLGLVAFQAIIMGLTSLSVSLPISTAVSAIVFSIYLYLMLKMYIYGYIGHKGIFYEVVRFGLVGVIAAMFDFTTCYIFQYLILPQSWSDIALTIVSVTFGFMVGVFVNYICSVYIVFRNTTDKNKSRTLFGRFLFVALASMGLFMGYGFQYLFFNLLHLGYILTFVIRTLIVLVWNYLSRKFFIFK